MKTDPVTMTLLYDEYGALLTEKQRDCCDLYFNQDLSLAEIAEELQISRQAVHDSITRAEATLKETESVLGNIQRAEHLRRAAREILFCSEALAASSDPQTRTLAARISGAAQTLL